MTRMLAGSMLVSIAVLIAGSTEADELSPAWGNYQTIIWQQRNATQYRTLRQLGVTAGMAYLGGKDDIGDLDNQTAPLLASNLSWYIENIATDFYSAYHRAMGDKPVNSRFAEAKSIYQANPDNLASQIRDPSLTDPYWLEKIGVRLDNVVAAQGRYRPLFYNLADEPGIADLSVAWDFDFSQSSLKGFRQYLQDEYRSIPALNREWGSDFSAWNHVVPLTTRQAFRRTDGNFSAWADFKAWMDTAFADALRRGTASIHLADPRALSGIEGAQDSGWGGYDYSRLANSVDVIEIYDDAENMAALRSFDPEKILLTTSTVGAPNQVHDLWQKLTRGTRGAILWDPNSKLVREDGSATDLGKELGAVFSKIEGSLGRLVMSSKPSFDPVAILYSPASMRTSWLLDWQPKGDAWSNSDADSDYDNPNAVRATMQDDLIALWHAAIAPRFLTDDAITQGELIRASYRVLVLPQSIALSSGAAGQIIAFVQRGGVLLAQGQPGAYDQHSRRLARPSLADLFEASKATKGRRGNAVLLSEPDSGKSVARIAERFIPRWFDTFGGHRSDFEIHRWQNGDLSLFSVQRDLLSDDNPAQSQERALDESIELVLHRPFYVYDVRSGKNLGRTRKVRLDLDDVEPAFIAFSLNPLGIP